MKKTCPELVVTDHDRMVQPTRGCRRMSDKSNAVGMCCPNVYRLDIRFDMP
jgi:hypothetical protein